LAPKSFDKDVLRKALRDIEISRRPSFDKALADRAEQELKRQYVNRSLYGAEIITTITPTERNRVNLYLSLSLKAIWPRSKKCVSLGKQDFLSNPTLLDQLDQNTGNWLSWYTKTEQLFAHQAQCGSGNFACLVLIAVAFWSSASTQRKWPFHHNKQDISITFEHHGG
jgi:outer membrane protein assembly factor BamA